MSYADSMLTESWERSIPKTGALLSGSSVRPRRAENARPNRACIVEALTNQRTMKKSHSLANAWLCLFIDPLSCTHSRLQKSVIQCFLNSLSFRRDESSITLPLFTWKHLVRFNKRAGVFYLTLITYLRWQNHAQFRDQLLNQICPRCKLCN